MYFPVLICVATFLFVGGEKDDEFQLESNSDYFDEVLHEARQGIRRHFQEKLSLMTPLSLPQNEIKEFGGVESTELENWDDGWKIIRLKDYTLGLDFRNRRARVYLISVGSKISLQKIMDVELESYGPPADILEVFEHNNKLWIFESSSVGNTVFSTTVRFDFDNDSRRDHRGNQVRGRISGLKPFIFEDSVHVCVLHKRQPSGVVHLAILADNGKAFNASLDVPLNRSIVHPKLAYLNCESQIYIIVYDEIFTIYKFDGSTVKRIYEEDKPVDEVFIFNGQYSSTRMIVMIHKDKLETFQFADKKLSKLNAVNLDHAMQRAKVVKSVNGGFIVFYSETSVFIYGLDGKGEFSFKSKLETECPQILNIFVIEHQGNMDLLLLCRKDDSTTIELKELKFAGRNDIQMDSPEGPRVEKCLNEIEGSISRQKFYLQKFLSERKILSDDKDQILTEPVSFKSVEVIKELRGHNFELTPTQNFNRTLQRMADLGDKISYLSNKIKMAEAKLPTLMTFGKDQHVTATINVRKMIANDSNILSIDVEEVNGVPLEDYKTKYLLLDQDQIVNTDVEFEKIITKNVNSEHLFNNEVNISSEDLLKSHESNQVVSGNHSFASIEVKNEINRLASHQPIKINDIQTNDIVKKFSDVLFEGTKSFYGVLKARESVHLQNLNGINFDLWRDSLVRLEDKGRFPLGGSVVVNGDVKVAGKVKALSINGLDIKRLFETSARKGQSHLVFKDEIIVDEVRTGSLNVKRVNRIDWKDLLRLRSSHASAVFNVDEGVVFKDLNANSINGLNFLDEVLRSGPPQNVTGRITFANTVRVDSPEGVTMSAGATINGVDPSLLSLRTASRNQVVSHKFNLAKVLEVKGDVHIEKINNLKFPQLNSDFWLKSTSQRIPVGTSLRNVKFKKPLFCFTLNGAEPPSYLLKTSSQTLTNENFFMSNVVVDGNVEIKEGETVNGIDLSNLRDYALTLTGKQAVYGKTIFSRGITINDLTLTRDLGDSLSRVLDAHDGTIPLYRGNLHFRNKVLTNSLEVKNLNVGSINGRPASAVLNHDRNTVTEIHGHLYFRDLKVQSLSVKQKLNNYSFNDWLSKSFVEGKGDVYLKKPVFVKGNVEFTGNVDIDVMNSKPLAKFIGELGRNCNNCRIRGIKNFSQPIDISRDLTVQFINGYNLEELRGKMLSRTKYQNIDGFYRFNNGVTAVHVETPLLGDIPVQEIVLKHKPLKFGSSVKFTSNSVFKDVRSVEGLIGSCNPIEAFNQSTKSLDNLVTSNISIGHVKVTGDVKVTEAFPAFSHNTDINYFIGNVVTKSTKQIIHGPSSFHSDVFLNSLDAKYVNKMPSREFLRKISGSPSNVQTNCSLSFNRLSSKKVIANNVKVNTINGHDYEVLSNLSVKREEGKYITGLKTFTHAKITGNLQTTGIGNYLFKDLMTIEDDAPKNLVFKSPIFVHDVWVNGTIAGIDPKELFKLPNSRKNFSSLFPPNVSSFLIKGNLISKYINNLKLEDVFLKSRKVNRVKGVKTILGGVFVDGFVHMDRINGIDINEMIELSSTSIESDRLSRFASAGTSGAQNLKLAIEKLAYLVKRVNHLNMQLIKGRGPKLLYISKEDQMVLIGQLLIKSLRSYSLGDIAINAEYQECRKWKKCPCIENHALKISTKSRLVHGDQKVKGNNIRAILGDSGHLYNFNVRCENDELLTTASSFIYNTEGDEHLVTTTELKLGDLKEVLPFSIDEKQYLLFLTIPDEDELSLLVMTSELDETTWKLSLHRKDVGLSLKKVCNVWYLLITDKASRENSTLLHWNNDEEKFVNFGTFPPATVGEIVGHRGKTFLILGSDTNKYEECLRQDIGILKVYVLEGRSRFKPFSSVQVSAKSLVSFEASGTFYLAVASSGPENSVVVFRFLEEEGLVREASYSISRPMEMVHRHERASHYLVVTSNNKYVTLLLLHFGGVIL